MTNWHSELSIYNETNWFHRNNSWLFETKRAGIKRFATRVSPNCESILVNRSEHSQKEEKVRVFLVRTHHLQRPFLKFIFRKRPFWGELTITPNSCLFSAEVTATKMSFAISRWVISCLLLYTITCKSGAYRPSLINRSKFHLDSRRLKSFFFLLSVTWKIIEQIIHASIKHNN